MIWLWGTTADQVQKAQKLKEWTQDQSTKKKQQRVRRGGGGITSTRQRRRHDGAMRKTKHCNAPWFILDRFLNGESRSIATMPMLKICTPPPDMYSMNACMGRDLTGEMAKSQAFLVFKSSYELTTASAPAPAPAAAVVLVFADEDLPPAPPLDAFPYNDDNNIIRYIQFRNVSEH